MQVPASLQKRPPSLWIGKGFAVDSLNRHYKDALPEKTVNRIKAILARSGIKVAETKCINNGDRLFSLGLCLRGFAFQVNGKGSSRLFARASAYAELAERLQNLMVYPSVPFRPEFKTRYGFYLRRP